MQTYQREEQNTKKQQRKASEPNQNTDMSKTERVTRKGTRLSLIPTQWQLLNLVECVAQR